MSIDWDIVLKAWAVIGPLLAAAISAVWARRVQVSDREHEDKKDKLRFDRDHARTETALSREKKQKRYTELKDAVTSFLACSHQYVLKQSDQMSYPSPENKAAATSAFDEFIRQAQVILISGDQELENSTIEFWNLIAGIPKVYASPSTDDYEKKLAAYKEARRKFTAEAKRVLEKYQDEV